MGFRNYIYIYIYIYMYIYIISQYLAELGQTFAQEVRRLGKATFNLISEGKPSKRQLGCSEVVLDIL